MKNKILITLIILILLFVCVKLASGKTKLAMTSIQTSASGLSNKKIGWGIKRANNHEQPDLGTTNKSLLEKYNGIAMGNKEDKKVYLTFDMGYEAGYTEKILNVLKENNVKACFFITAHYLNTQPDLVKRIIDEGHILGNHVPNCLMSRIEKV